MISTKLFVLLSGSAGAVVVGAAPALDSDLPLVALLAAGAGAVASGVWHLVHTRPVDR